MINLDLNPTRFVKSHSVGNYAAFVAQFVSDDSICLFVFNEGKEVVVCFDKDDLITYPVDYDTIEALCMAYDLMPIAYLQRSDFTLTARVE